MSPIFGTVVAVFLVAICCFLAIRSMIRDKKAGKSIQCGGNCKNCTGCH